MLSHKKKNKGVVVLLIFNLYMYRIYVSICLLFCLSVCLSVYLHLKNGLQADRMTLCACIWSSSQARVMSKKSLSSRSSRKETLMLDSKSFQRRQNFSLAPMLAGWLAEGVTYFSYLQERGTSQ